MVKSTDMFIVNECEIPGVFEIIPKIHEDSRGKFVKVFHKPSFESLELDHDFVEEYYSISYKSVLRGMHFQSPPHDLKKLVYCVQGEVLDVVLDLRKKSPTYGKHRKFNLSEKKRNMIYISEGIAHGFYVQSDLAIMVYKTTHIYDQQYDHGIKYDSIGCEWLASDPIISPRDLLFPPLRDFQTPF
jgi:dTDP-4-dehydrorhamnose 3,5-epimerase